MTKRTPSRSSKDVLEHLDELMDSVPINDDEADEILREAGIDAAAEFRRALQLVDDAERRMKYASYARAEEERTAALRRIAHPRRQRSRPELEARLSELRQIAPPEAQPQAYWKNYQSASDEDLERTVSDFEHLLGLDDDGNE